MFFKSYDYITKKMSTLRKKTDFTTQDCGASQAMTARLEEAVKKPKEYKPVNNYDRSKGVQSRHFPMAKKNVQSSTNCMITNCGCVATSSGLCTNHICATCKVPALRGACMNH